MLIAMTDLLIGYTDDDSPSRDGRTLAALRRRKYINDDNTITPRGYAWAQAAAYDVIDVYQVRRRPRKRAA